MKSLKKITQAINSLPAYPMRLQHSDGIIIVDAFVAMDVLAILGDAPHDWLESALDKKHENDPQARHGSKK